MSRERKHRERQALREARELRDRLAALALAEARGVAVDPAALAINDGLSTPSYVDRGYYEDVAFDCEGCGAPQTWTAERQKWWYEVARGPAFSRARRCRACRVALRERHGGTPRRSQAERNRETEGQGGG